MDLLKSLFTLLTSRNVDGVLASFKVTQSRLLALAEKKEKEADKQLAESRRILEEAQAKTAEAGRAKKVADNLKRLCGEPE